MLWLCRWSWKINSEGNDRLFMKLFPFQIKRRNGSVLNRLQSDQKRPHPSKVCSFICIHVTPCTSNICLLYVYMSQKILESSRWNCIIECLKQICKNILIYTFVSLPATHHSSNKGTMYCIWLLCIFRISFSIECAFLIVPSHFHYQNEEQKLAKEEFLFSLKMT